MARFKPSASWLSSPIVSSPIVNSEVQQQTILWRVTKDTSNCLLRPMICQLTNQVSRVNRNQSPSRRTFRLLRTTESSTGTTSLSWERLSGVATERYVAFYVFFHCIQKAYWWQFITLLMLSGIIIKAVSDYCQLVVVKCLPNYLITNANLPLFTVHYLSLLAWQSRGLGFLILPGQKFVWRFLFHLGP